MNIEEEMLKINKNRQESEILKTACSLVGVT